MIKSLIKRTMWLLLATVLISGLGLANGLNLNGLGAGAVSMGGAWSTGTRLELAS